MNNTVPFGHSAKTHKAAANFAYLQKRGLLPDGALNQRTVGELLHGDLAKAERQTIKQVAVALHKPQPAIILP